MATDVNIGIFNECFPPVMDGVSVCAQNYAYWLQKKVGGVCVITPKNRGVDYNEDYEVLQYMSVPVPFRKPYVTGVAEIDPVFMVNILKRHFKIVHAHSPFSSGWCAHNIKTIQRIPMVATFHSKYRDDFERVLPTRFMVDQVIKSIIGFYESADEVWVPQESVKEVIREYGYKGQVEVVDNGSDLVEDYPEKYFVDARNELGISPDEFVLLFVGQHIWEKNTRFVIDALEKIKDTAFRMYFIGTGYAAEDMRKLVSEKGLDSQVTFLGMVTDRGLLKKYYAASDLFLFPSIYDNAPLVVREAAALHTPSLMMEGSTASAILKDGVNGFLVKNDLDEFATYIKSLIADPDRVHRVGEQASRSIVRSWEDIVAEVLDRYNALIARKKLIGSV